MGPPVGHQAGKRRPLGKVVVVRDPAATEPGLHAQSGRAPVSSTSMAQLRDKRIVRCALAAVGSAAFLVAFLELLTVFPTRVNVVLFGLALIVFFLGYLRSPYFSRRQTGGEPCPACGGLGYHVAAHPFYMHRGRCGRCGGRGRAPA